jgi:hypothetical protein
VSGGRMQGRAAGPATSLQTDHTPGAGSVKSVLRRLFEPLS